MEKKQNLALDLQDLYRARLFIQITKINVRLWVGSHIFFFPQVEITIINKINIDKFKYDMCEFLINDTIRGIILYFF
jgi:hypothetical protein